MNLLKHHNNKNTVQFKAFTIIELVVGVLVFAIAGTMLIRLTNSTTSAMNKMNRQSKVDSAIAAHLEKLRDESFRHLCTNGCDSGELSKPLEYDTDTLIPLCDGGQGNGLGNHLLTALNIKGLNPTSFNVQDYDETADSITINSTITEDPSNPNLLQVILNANEFNKQVTTTIMPTAQKWCP